MAKISPHILSPICAVAVVLLSGCTMNHKSAPTTQAVAAAPAPSATAKNAPVDDIDSFDNQGVGTAPATPAPVVNVFGEINGVSLGPVRTIGDVGFQQHTFLDEGEDADVQLDPTGKWMVFASTRHSEHAAIYLQRVDGTAVTRLTNDDSDNAFPAFSPDGQTIAFCSTRSGVWNLYTMDVEGRNIVTVTSGSAQCIHPSFSPDGTRLVYSALGARSNQWELWIVNLTNGEKRQIGDGLFPSWSPGHETDRIAFQRARQRGSRWFSLWTLDLVDGEARRETEVAVSSNAAIVSPVWSPDGKHLAFATVLDPSRGAKKSSTSRGEQDIWTIDADGNGRRRLTDGTGINLTPFWGADNRVYFISNRSGNEAVWSAKPSLGKVFTAAAPAEKTQKPAGESLGSTNTGDDR